MADLPELLAPAGSPEALDAAIEGGADAVYFGGASFNARMNAKNFDSDALRSAVARAHSYGVKCYVTLNTLVTDRELDACLAAAREDREAGVDGLIVADTGVASIIHEVFPDLPLHASTQASGHCKDMSAELKKLGFSRMVMAREASLDDIRSFTRGTDMELEVFVHGALCVCHSGQCLFSSLVGGRSGNRGECAQPCRLPFIDRAGKQYYPLSLKDLCLARHLPELIAAGVSSLKIEGRMKPPEYVLAVTRIWRRLLDERRGATDAEMEELAAVFSRGGFTDGYFSGNVGRRMLGVRSENDKLSTRALPEFTGLTRRVPIDMTARIKAGEPITLSVTAGGKSVTVAGDPPELARTSPMTRDDYKKNLLKLGGTAYRPGNITIESDPGLMVPVSKLNALRRSALTSLLPSAYPTLPETTVKIPAPSGKRESSNTAYFVSPDRVTEKAKKYFDVIYLPLDKYDGSVSGVALPPVIFDRETETVRDLLDRAISLGAEDILVSNIGHLSLARSSGLNIRGDFRLNVTNTATVTALEELGIPCVIASPELTLPQLRDLGGNTSAIVYGRIPLMLLEKCVICETPSGCPGKSAGLHCSSVLKDRRGVEFPVLREGSGHRNVIYNSLVTNMSDRLSDLESNRITARHFIFSIETPSEADRVIDAFRSSSALPYRVRRIK